MSTSNSDSKYNVNDNFSKQIIQDINDFNKIKYQKRAVSASKINNTKLDTAIRKLHHKYKSYGNDYKTLVTLGETDQTKIKNNIIALQKDEEERKGSINNPFTTSGGKKKVTKKRKKQLRKTKKLK
jgi:hypothetical protein